MYFNSSNNHFHGIMFHYFHDNKKHLKSQGSISADEFYKIIKFIGKKNIINSEIFLEKLKSNKLKKNDVCLTFYDSVKSQFDIALPVLEDQNIKSFFFVHTSIFENRPDNLEVFRYFRTKFFKNINDFYDNFYQNFNIDLKTFFEKKSKIIKEKKKKFSFYSFEDIKFRLVRDNLLSQNEYKKIILKMMKQKKFDPKDIYTKLFLTKKDIIQLDSLNHSIGLHSHSHPTLIEKLNYNEQKNEYEKNLKILSEILNKNVNELNCISHPCGSYNNETLRLLKNLGLEIGFRQDMKIEKEKKMTKINNSKLEIARQDHAEILMRMN